MITSAGHSLHIHLSRNDGQAANTLTRILSTVAGADFQIRTAVLHELGGTGAFVALRAWFKGRSADEAGAVNKVLADLGQSAFSAEER
ncbi:hypothetical protein [Paraburkholderia graminis]|uniref:hypothetical protein n=1 Tax=Paraburkholderia graminis TaxID=60548 RepID=UPI0038BC80AF